MYPQASYHVPVKKIRVYFSLRTNLSISGYNKEDVVKKEDKSNISRSNEILQSIYKCPLFLERY